MHVVHVILQNPVYARSQVLSPGDQGRPRRRTDRCPGMKFCETDAFRGQFIKRRSLHRSAVTADVLGPEIVSQQQDDVGPFSTSRIRVGAQGGFAGRFNFLRRSCLFRCAAACGGIVTEVLGVGFRQPFLELGFRGCELRVIGEILPLLPIGLRVVELLFVVAVVDVVEFACANRVIRAMPVR